LAIIKLYALWRSAHGHKESFANGSFTAMNLMVLDEEHWVFFGHKKAPHLHVRLLVFLG
jgi:hypothetical protein